jgi:hypothetical protein
MGKHVMTLGGFSAHIAGGAFMIINVSSLLPFNSITMFLFDRQYFRREAAGEVYSHRCAHILRRNVLEM